MAITLPLVALKWFVDEPLFDKARELQRHSLAAPDLIFAEAAKVMWKLWRRGFLTDVHYAARGEALKDAPLAVAPVRDLLASAMRLARSSSTTRSTTVSICRWRFGRAAGLPAVTADHRFAAVSAGHPYLSKFIQKL